MDGKEIKLKVKKKKIYIYIYEMLKIRESLFP